MGTDKDSVDDDEAADEDSGMDIGEFEGTEEDEDDASD